MINWFYNWLDPKILKLEKWVNNKVVELDKIDIDLDKIKVGEVRDNPMFRQPPNSGEYGPFLTNLQGAKVKEYLIGPGEMEAFALLDLNGELWWRHRDAGTTEDFRYPAFSDLKNFFEYATGNTEKFWACMLRTKAMLSEERAVNEVRV
jgi:hypothetical protein